VKRLPRWGRWTLALTLAPPFAMIVVGLDVALAQGMIEAFR